MTVPKPRRGSLGGSASSSRSNGDSNMKSLLTRPMTVGFLTMIAMFLFTVYQSQMSLSYAREPCLPTVTELKEDSSSIPGVADKEEVNIESKRPEQEQTLAETKQEASPELASGLTNDDPKLAMQEAVKTPPSSPLTVLPTAAPLDLLPPEDLSPNFRFNDVFAASWWQRMSRFTEFDVEEINIVEDDAFKPILKAGNGFSDVRMARDWLDFSLEHLSKWWKLGGKSSMMYGIGKLHSYIGKVMNNERRDSVMDSTLAVIPYGVRSRDKLEIQMWATCLAATMASLLQHGVARIVVVGYYPSDYTCAKSAFSQLLRYQHGFLNDGADDHKKRRRRLTTSDTDKKVPDYKQSFSAMIGDTEIAFVHTNEVNSTYIRENIPKGALKGVQEAMNGTSKAVSDWVGNNPSRFKYVFLTEADQILNARMTPMFLQELDKNRIIIPHRLQPIPHQLDLTGVVEDEESKLLQASQFPDIYELNPETDSCCDTNQHVDREKVKSCGFWWQCGFNRHGNFDHLKEYNFMRLTEGTGIVSLTANEHSRRCQPQKNKRGCSSVEPKVKEEKKKRVKEELVERSARGDSYRGKPSN